MEITDKILRAFFPSRCTACGALVEGDVPFCERCRREVRVITPPICRFCGRGALPCGCFGGDYGFERCVSLYEYDGQAREGLLRLKFRGHVENGTPFANALRELILREYGDKFDIMTCVPLSDKSLRRRGYNQCELICRKLAPRLNVPFDGRLLRKLRETRTQHTLDREMRRRNVRGAFGVDERADLSGKTVLLVDDIFTTGWTLSACADALKAAGADSVLCCTVASTMPSEIK